MPVAPPPVPLDTTDLPVATAHHHMGIQLLALGERAGSTRHLRDAVRHLDLAIEAYEALGARAFAATARPNRDRALALLAERAA
jgi:hypothetical protein